MDTTTKAPRYLQGISDNAEPVGDYVAVIDEPQHYHRFENEFVRVYDVRFAPGEHSLYHRHDEDTMYVTVRDVIARLSERGDPFRAILGRRPVLPTLGT